MKDRLARTMIDIGATYTGPQIVAPSSGNIDDLDVLTLPSNVAPVHQRVPTQYLASSPGSLVISWTTRRWTTSIPRASSAESNAP
jgi:hypothetical protein